MNKYYRYLDYGIGVTNRGAAPIIQKHRPRSLMTALNTLAAAVVALSLAGPNTATAAPNTPSDMPVSPLFGALDFSQAMLRFEEFGVRPMPTPGSTTPTPFTAPTTCNSRPPIADMDTLLDADLWPDPTVQANTNAIHTDPVLGPVGNPWTAMINTCIPGAITLPGGGVPEGRPPGIDFAHQRYSEMPPQLYFATAQGGARAGTGIRDDEQSHTFSVGEFGPVVAGQEGQTGLYHSAVGIPGLLDGTNAGIDIRFHPSMPIQDPLALWTFGDGTLPPKLLRTRLGVPILMRHYNALPIDVTANRAPTSPFIGFGEHTITTHEHNGHNPGEVDGFAGAYYFPGEFYDYRWPMQVAGYDSINRDASDPRASTPCSPTEDLNGNGILDTGEDRNGNGLLDLAEVLNIPDPISGAPVAKTCDPDTGTVNFAGDWHEIMSTHWFHDHMIDRTSENVYKGNAAMMNYYSGIDRGHEGFRCEYADPANNINLCFPSGTALDWGNRDYDVQLLVADKAWGADGQLAMGDIVNQTNGFLADRILVNWLYKPYFDVRARQYRFRILNGSVSRFFKLALVREFNDATSGDLAGLAGTNTSYSRVPFHMIANDGNIMEHAVLFPNAQSNDLPMQAIAERYDIIVDFDQFPVGTKLYFVNTAEFGNNGRGPDGVVPLGDILNGTYAAIPDLVGCTDHCWDNDPTIGKIMELRVQAYTGTDTSMNPADYEIGKKMMIPLVKATDAEIAAATHRTFHFGRGGGNASDNRPTPWTIETDGVGGALNASVNRVSAAPETMGDPANGIAPTWEIWHLTSGGGWAHPIHIHFEEGQYLLRKDELPGTERLPPLWEQGARKDMYRVSNLGEGPDGLPDSSLGIDVLIRFREFAGTFVEHCHNTTHEDKAMLLRWDNETPGQTVRIRTPIPEWNGVNYVSPATPFTHVPPGDPVETAVQELTTIKTGSGLPVGFVSPLQIEGDLDWNALVDLNDFSIFRSQFGLAGLWASNLNQDANVNLSDFSIFRSNFGLSAGFPLPNNNPIP